MLGAARGHPMARQHKATGRQVPAGAVVLLALLLLVLAAACGSGSDIADDTTVEPTPAATEDAPAATATPSATATSSPIKMTLSSRRIS